MKLPPSADCRRRFTFVNRHQFPIFKKQCGGADRDRTCDLLNANQMLSQLSYAPTKRKKVTQTQFRHQEFSAGKYLEFWPCSCLDQRALLERDLAGS